ncbi:MAG: PHP domain-containing protein [bacterium]|nr:PHP domain-containing protein [bacterium]
MIDLHTHTTASDGSFAPAALVRLAKAEGLTAIAITDHDTTAGNQEALAAGKEIGMEVVPGVEISADSPFGTLHIVGLYIDPSNVPMETTLKELRDFREARNLKMITRFNEELGIPITLEELATEAGGDVIGRPHFANLLVKKGAVKTYQEAFDKYLKSGGKAYLDKKRLFAPDAIRMIKEAGGVPILAHPYIVREKSESRFEANLRYLVDEGLAGIEVYYSEHSSGDEALYADLARRHNLLVSGGTDFHGTVKPDVKLGRGHGNLDIPYELLNQIKDSRQ